MAPSAEVVMRSFWSDPYLWIHLAGLAAFPLFLEGCLLGLAVGEPFLPVWVELLLVAIVGIAPILWMQWQRPFYIFSLVAVTVKPEALTDDQRRLLTLFKLPRNRVLAVLVSVALVVVLRQVYELSPIAAPAASFLAESHVLGLLLAALAFLACNLFVQVPISVASVMLTSQSAFATALPYPPENIRRNFTLVGLTLNQLLPPVIPDAKPALVQAVQVPVAGAIDPSQPATEVLTDDLWADTAESASAATSTDASVEATLSDEAEDTHSSSALLDVDNQSEQGTSSP